MHLNATQAASGAHTHTHTPLYSLSGRWPSPAVDPERCQDPPQQVHAGSSHGEITTSSSWFLANGIIIIHTYIYIYINMFKEYLTPPRVCL